MSSRAPAAARALAILDLIASSSDGAFTLSQICDRLNMNLSSAHSILGTMVERGYLVRHPELRLYSLGPSVVVAGNAALDRHPVIAHAREEMRRISANLDLECMAAWPVGEELVIVGRAGRPNPNRPLVTVGQRVPLLPPAGVLVFAWSSPQEIESWLGKLGPETTAAELTHHRAAIAACRELGYHMGVRVENDPRSTSRNVLVSGSPPVLELGTGPQPIAHVTSCAFDEHGAVAILIFVDGFPAPLTAEEAMEIGEMLRESGLVITRLSGGVPPYERRP